MHVVYSFFHFIIEVYVYSSLYIVAQKWKNSIRIFCSQKMEKYIIFMERK